MQSEELVAALRKVGLLDRNGWIKMDPRMASRRAVHAVPAAPAAPVLAGPGTALT